MTAEDGFVARHGLVQYRPSQLRKYSRDGVCEICGYPPSGKPMLVFDHCHEHGWIRGLICNYCNDQVGWIENRWTNYEVYEHVVLRFPKWRRNCPDCRAGESDADEANSAA